MIVKKMQDHSRLSLTDVVRSWVEASVEDTRDEDPRVFLVRTLLYRSDLTANEVREIFRAVYPHERDGFLNEVLEMELC
jgi:predicted HAD superfamily Cof-like phosphohydrolase